MSYGHRLVFSDKQRSGILQYKVLINVKKQQTTNSNKTENREKYTYSVANTCFGNKFTVISTKYIV